MKYIKSIVLIYTITFIMIGSVSASTTGIVNVNDSLTLRNKPTTYGDYITSFYNNTELEILDTNAGSGNGCNDNWYKVKYGNYTGYSCGSFIVIKNNEKEYISEDDSYNKNDYDTNLSHDGSIMCYEDDGDLNLRNTAGGSTNGKKVSCGELVNVNQVQESNGKCPYYYNITTTSGNTGWVCGYFVNTTKLSSTAQNYYNKNGGVNAYYESLKNKGFPESYLPYLAEIHARYPNWNFEAEKINLKFSDVVAGESGNGASLLQGSAFGEGYRSLNSNTYNILNDKFSYYPSEYEWYNASEEAIAYFMDPRNYLNTKYIFAFETLGYSSNQNVSVVSSILSGQSFWPNVYNYYNKDNAIQDSTKNVSTDIVKASSDVGISAVHVATRIKQEITGIDYSDARLGGNFNYDNKTYNGFYNFFNINVYGSNKIVNGMKHAMDNEWNTPFKGILGGASFMYNDYISINQDTIYYEKFDVSTNNGNYTHQYMQNLASPMQEGGLKYNGYINSLASYLNNGVTFVIPIYNEMPNYAVRAPKIGNPNNYLKNLSVNGNTVPNFSYDTYNYNVYLDSNINNVEINASTINNNAKINGTGNIKINSNEQTNEIIVTSQNGKVRKYNIKFIRKEMSKISVKEAMDNSGFKYNDKYVFGVNLNTAVSQIIGNITSYNNSVLIDVMDSNENTKNNGNFVTGDKIKVAGSDDTKKYEIVIYGDASGDGKINASDYVFVKNYILKTMTLNGAYLEAADVNKDGKVNATDYVLIKNSILGTYKINQ